MDSFIMGGMYLTHAGRYLGTYLLTTMTPLGLVPYLFLKYRMQPAYIGRYLLVIQVPNVRHQGTDYLIP